MSVPLAGQKILASDLSSIFPHNTDAWVDYTPTWTQSVAVTKTTNWAKYSRSARLVSVDVYMTATGAGVANNAVTVTLPVTAARAGSVAGGGFFLFDASAGTFYTGMPLLATTTTVVFYANAVTAAIGQTGGSFTAALASPDQLRFNILYEAAS